MEENILEIVEKSCQIHRDVIAVKYLSHRDIVEKSYGDLWDDCLLYTSPSPRDS